jgi:hypothetical protein
VELSKAAVAAVTNPSNLAQFQTFGRGLQALRDQDVVEEIRDATGVSESEARIAARNTLAELGGHLGWPKAPVQIAGRLSRFHRQEVWWVPVRCVVARAA